VFLRRAGKLRITVRPPASSNPKLGYVEFRRLGCRRTDKLCWRAEGAAGRWAG